MSSPSLRPACPCCVFLTQDLFLPPSQSTTTTEPSTTDEPASEVVSPPEALRVIQQHAEQLKLQGGKPVALLVDTHNHAHLKRERHSAYELQQQEEEAVTLPVVSLTLAVEPVDWDDALRFSAEQSSPDTTIMGLGVHPWYLGDGSSIEPQGPWKERLDALLQEHPSCIVGEVGLCKMAKCARTHPEGKTRGFEIQRAVLEDQIQLAVQHQRPVSIHCVQQHGVFLDSLKKILTNYKSNNGTDPFRFVPPAMAMHSFTGTAHHVKQLLQWEATLFGEGPNDSKKKKKKKKQQEEQSTQEEPPPPPPRPPLFYFGFSHIVNYDMCTSDKARRQGREAVRAVPPDRLLAESDVHHPQDVPAGTAGAIAYMAWALEEPIPLVAERTARNGLTFLKSHLGGTTQ